jgi:CRISPR/Cas system CMR-associated protein Cmr1 (group 7 of RAMP superfamily)
MTNEDSFTSQKVLNIICEKDRQISSLINQVDQLEKENIEIKHSIFYKDLNSKANAERASDKWMIKYLKLKDETKRIIVKSNQRANAYNQSIQKLNV